MMHKPEWIALFISLAGVAAAMQVATRVFEAVPHVEDEMAYVWQANVYAHGQLTAPTPADPQNILIPFVVDANGHRFAKYPPGWPMILALGILLKIRTWVNPLLAGLAIWLTFRLGQRIFNSTTGILAAILTTISPFFLVISGSLDSELWSLVLSLILALSWLELFGPWRDPKPTHPIPAWILVSVAGSSLGMLVLTRPLTALGVAVPFFIHGMVLLGRGGSSSRKQVISIGVISLLIGSLFLVWQYGVTGSLLTDPYTLWWSFDRIGFGKGIGLEPGGHSLIYGLRNTLTLLRDGNLDLFGWGRFSWVFLPPGLWAARKKWPAWMILGVFAGLVGAYVFYWAVALNYGPRYYFEGIFALTLLSAAGIIWLTGPVKDQGWRLMRLGLTGLALAALTSYNLTAYLPARFMQLYGLYGIHVSQLIPFSTAQARAQTPALVLVHAQKNWTEYAGLIELEDPWLTTPFIFAWSNNSSVGDARLAADYANRNIIYYYPDTSDELFRTPQPTVSESLP